MSDRTSSPRVQPGILTPFLDGLDARGDHPAVIKVRGDDPAGVAAVAEMYGGEAVQAGSEVVTVELTGTETQVDEAIEAFERFGVREVARTGTAALAAGTEPTA